MGGQGRMSEQEAAVLARHVQNEGTRRLQKERAEQSGKNRAEGQAFLETNKKHSGVVSLPSGLQYEVLRPGTGARPAADDAVKVHFRGTLMDGTVFDSSFDRGQPVVVRPDTTIPAWTEALPNMSVGAKWKLFVPADLGYGDKVADNIPPGSTLIFEVELLSIEPKAEQKAPGSEGSPRP
jgi:FKBP-type peptidyl-prolyl cis-trans isomerase FklB